MKDFNGIISKGSDVYSLESKYWRQSYVDFQKQKSRYTFGNTQTYQFKDIADKSHSHIVGCYGEGLQVLAKLEDGLL